MFSQLALMMVMMWPFIPMFLIQIHFATDFWRKLGTWTYAAVLLEWLPIAGVIYLLQEPILQYEIALITPFVISGALLIVAGIVLHAWTAKLLGIKATISYTELKPQITDKKDLITSGPFGVVRHPSYWAHTAIILGVFLITGTAAVGAIAIIDLAITYFVTTELEERELTARFGTQYEEYKKRVPKFFPKLGI